MVRRKMRLIAVAGLAFMLAFALAGGAVAAKPETADGARWIVAFDGEWVVNEAAREAIVKGVGGVIEHPLPAIDAAIVLLPSQAAAKGLAKQKGVLWVEEDSYRYYHLQPLPWGIDRIDAEYAWAGNTGDGVNVAVLDTGIDTDHLDLWANLEGGYSCVNRDTSNVEDKNGHGTHCSGIIAALNNEIGVVGVGPDIDLWMVQISKGARIRLTDILEGIQWCIDTQGAANPIQVMSMSYGGGYSESEDQLLQAAYGAGVVLVSSAGNQNGGAVTYPAALPQVIAVSAVDKYDQIASFSSTGSEVELAAPGVSIYSTYKNGGYETLSGTSMACPHVSGVVALVLNSGFGRDFDGDGIIDVDYDADGDGRWDPAEVRACLADTAEDIGLSPEQQGNGLVDAEKAVLGTTSGDNLAPPANQAPVADAGTDQTVNVGDTVQLDGTGSYDPDGDPITYSWAFVSMPTDSTATLSGADTATPTFVADVEGTYEVELTVSDGELIDSDSVTITATTVAPTGTMHVAAIDMWYSTAGPNFFIYTEVTIVDADNVALPGATVYLEMTLPDGSKASGSGDTADDGTVTFKLRSRQTGTYTSTVTDVVKDGWTYDSLANVETSKSLIVP